MFSSIARSLFLRKRKVLIRNKVLKKGTGLVDS